MQTDTDRILLEVRTSRTGEETPEAMTQFFASLVDVKRFVLPFWKRGVPLSFEIAVVDQMIHFYVAVPRDYLAFIESQLQTQYPTAFITHVEDYLPSLMRTTETLSVGQMKVTNGSFYSLRTYKDFRDVDPLSSLLGLLAKVEPTDAISLQLLLVPISKSWQSKGRSAAAHKQTDSSGRATPNPYAKFIQEKVMFDGFKTAIRLAVKSDSKPRSTQLIQQIGSSFATFNSPASNTIVFKRMFLWQKKRLINAMLTRSRHFMPQQILNVQELATLYHFPTSRLATVRNISWHKAIFSEPPETLPVLEGTEEKEQQDINFFAQTEFKNRMTKFGIKTEDRRKHMYIIGKTGSGKSTLIANLAINDMRANKGMCIVDPHGDLCETILNYIPSNRINDLVYLDPSDLEHTFRLNPLEVTDDYQRELVVSGIVAIFHKLYGTSWGPRLEYILRNCLLTAIQLPKPTMLLIPQLLTDDEFRRASMTYITDPVLKNFWEKEFENMPQRLRGEAISPILNKVGQFTGSRFIRNILQHPESTIDFEQIMNKKKILLLNLSQGKLGEDNSALLGAMIITKIQLAAMNRASLPEHERTDFYLSVDEFQNFATTSFIKILSEARKYRLNLILANQYISQIPQDVRGAIFGNAGTMMSFLIGAEDANYMAREFKERFKDEDLLALGNYQSIIKLAVDNITQSPFHCYTLPLPAQMTGNRENAIGQSQDRYMKKVAS